MIEDYMRWKFSGREWFEAVLWTCAITCVINLVCYRALWAFGLALPVLYPVIQFQKEEKIRNRKEVVYLHFRDLIALMKSSLQAGYSVENAVTDATTELAKTYGRKDPLVQELYYFRGKLELNVPVEQLFSDFGRRTGIDEVRSFASVLLIAKRTGGNMAEVFHNTWEVLCMRIETKREIEGMIASRKYEMTVMSMIPFGIILYVQAAFPEFLKVLYGNLTGCLIMTIALLIYLGALWLEQKIMQIEV